MNSWLKLVHVLAVVLFLGNIITGVFWHKHAERTRDARLIAHTMAGVIKSDRLFTLPGVFVILASGIFGAIQAGFPILRTSWILWTIVMFAISGAVFMFKLAPLQRTMQKHAADGALSGNFDLDAYHRLSRRWDFWGAIATLAPLIGVALMVLKPSF